MAEAQIDEFRKRLLSAMAVRVEWNDAITHARDMEIIAKQPGRYEYEVRYGGLNIRLRQRLDEANAALADLEEQCTRVGDDFQAICASVGGPPVPLIVEGPHVARWMQTPKT